MARFEGTFLQALILCVSLQACAAAAQSRPENGLWLSDGYGLLVEISDDGIHTFQLTTISCIAGWSAQRHHTAPGANESVFLGNDTVRLSDGPFDDIKRLHLDGTASDIVLHRTSQRPARCTQIADNSPQGNYAVFWQTLAEQYPFFPLHKIDWPLIDRKFRPQVTSETTSDQLFEIFRQMIQPLEDAHTGIAATDIKKNFAGWRQASDHLDDDEWQKVKKLIATRYIRDGLRSFCNGRVQFGRLDHSIGYLRITAFYGYVDRATYGAALAALQSALDTIFKNAGKLNGLVIDVRLNHGGDDLLGIEIASRLTNRRYLAYSKQARNNKDGALHFTDPQKIWVEPSTRPGFRGPVVSLIGSDTVSAGETFTMALLGRKPHVVRIGSNTQGVFSDVLNRSLANGWRFRLPNEVYLTSDGKAFDVTGVPPDIHVNWLSHGDPDNGRDVALEKAQSILLNARNQTAGMNP